MNTTRNYRALRSDAARFAGYCHVTRNGHNCRSCAAKTRYAKRITVRAERRAGRNELAFLTL